MLRSLEYSYWLTLALAVPTAGFLIRLFIIQHDCGHGNFFKSRRARDWVGRVIGTLLLTPYDYWRKTHAYHHAHSGDLDFRGFGDVDTITVDEYYALTRLQRLQYRIYRHPLVLFGVGPAYQFLVKHRYPTDAPKEWKQAWQSVWWTNLAIAVIVAVMWLTIGIENFLMVQLPVTLIGSTLGVWMFYVQHQFGLRAERLRGALGLESAGHERRGEQVLLWRGRHPGAREQRPPAHPPCDPHDC